MGFERGGRIGYAMGPGPVMSNTNDGIMDMGGLEKDYRFSGGFVPIGEYEKKMMSQRDYLKTNLYSQLMQ